MANPIKYNTSAETLALKKGNFYIGTGDVGKGPTSSTGYYNGVTPPSGGYTIYLNKASDGPAIYTVSTEAQLTAITNRIAGTSYTTSGECLTYFATQTDKMIFNKDCTPIITNGIVLTFDTTNKYLCYVNGVSLSRTYDNFAANGIPGFTTTVIGSSAGSEPYFNGNMQSAKFYNRALSQSEILKNYFATIPIVRNGLVLSLEAGNPTSYVSGSTAWVDTAGNTVGTLTNGPTYNSSNLGSIVFDGVDDYVAWPNNPLSSLTSITYECWFKFNSSFGNGFTISGPTLEVYLQSKNTWYTDRISRNNFSWTFNTNWNQLVFTYSSGAGASAYINGVSLTVNSGGGLSSQSTLWIGNRINLDSSINGNIAITRVYNRVLTSSEVTQNFNAQRTTFGI